MSGDMSADEPAREAELFQLDRHTCLALLATQCVGRLVLHVDEPAIVPVNYITTEGRIVFRSDPGPRVDAIVGSPVLFEVDMFDHRTRSGWSVIVRGRAEDVTATHGPEAAGADGAHRPVDTWAPGPKPCWIAIAVDDVTGRLLRGETGPTGVHPQAYL